MSRGHSVQLKLDQLKLDQRKLDQLKLDQLKLDQRDQRDQRDQLKLDQLDQLQCMNQFDDSGSFLSNNCDDGKVILVCRKENNKLVIRFHSFIVRGFIIKNVYHNFGWELPYSITKLCSVGMHYEIPSKHIYLCNETDTNSTNNPHYIVEITNLDEIKRFIPIKSCNNRKVFAMKECLTCMYKPAELVFTPCGHKCICTDCFANPTASGLSPDCAYKLSNNQCPLCARKIENIII